MNKLILGTVLVSSIFLVTGCVTETVYYTPTYTPSYAYSVGYYRTNPYWNVGYYNIDNDAYYYGYDDLGDVGYWGMYNSYNVY